jgi:hypothetical protein
MANSNASKYGFCRENRNPLTGYHIRKLGPLGRADQLVDTLALCGSRVEYDLKTEITQSALGTEAWRICPACKEEYRAYHSFGSTEGF